jgi:hypothetical protein
VLLSSACLFVHERYGIAVPIAVLAPVVVVAVVDVGRNLARAASLTVGFAVGLLGAGAFFWVRYAFYTTGSLTVPALAVVTVSTLLLIALAWKVEGRRRSVSGFALVYTVGAITFGQGIPDSDPMRPNALAAARRLDQLGAQLRRGVAANGALPPSLADMADGLTPLVGYRITYQGATGDRALLFRLLAEPDQYGVSGCHAFYTDGTGRFTYTRQPRPAEASDLSWR